MGNPGMRATPAIDYGVILDDEIWLELDDRKTFHLKEHDTVVRHDGITPGVIRRSNQRPSLSS
jgi:hypothetical protein